MEPGTWNAPEGRSDLEPIARPPANRTEYEALLVDGPDRGMREWTLNFPLYNGVNRVLVGVDSGAEVEPPLPFSVERPLLFYGSSITQGGCASRAGMVHTAILGRRFDRPVINLGFSGNGKMEPEMANLIAELDPAVFVLDCLPNMDGKLVSERVEPVVRTLRKARPRTPILNDRPHAASCHPAPSEVDLD